MYGRLTDIWSHQMRNSLTLMVAVITIHTATGGLPTHGAPLSCPQTIHAVTEESLLTDSERVLIGEVMHRAGCSWQTQYMPFARALDYAKRTPGVMIYSIARTPEREDKFQWVGPLLDVRRYLFKLKSRTDINIGSLAEAYKYRIALITSSSDDDFHTQQKAPLQSLDKTQSRYDMILRLVYGRSDLMSSSYMSYLELCKDFPDKCAEVEVAYDLGSAPSWYLAFNKNVDPVVFNRVCAALQSVKDDGFIDKVFAPFVSEIVQPKRPVRVPHVK